MKKLKFSEQINAPKEKVWDILWQDKSYREWTNVFSPGSHAVSDWNEGSRIYFLGPDGNGMYSRIDLKKPNEFMAFKHLGVLKDKVEQPNDDKAESWAGAMETYSLNNKSNGTELIVELDVTDDHQDYFEKTFPKALLKVKEMAET